MSSTDSLDESHIDPMATSPNNHHCYEGDIVDNNAAANRRATTTTTTVTDGDFVKNSKFPSTNHLDINIPQHPFYNDHATRFDLCRVCCSSADESSTDSLMVCIDCGEVFHYYCIDLPATSLANIDRGVWRCMNCKICERCNDSPPQYSSPIFFIDDKSKDTRVCQLCSQPGDLTPQGRLLPTDIQLQKWSHVNCVLWTSGIVEIDNTTFFNTVHLTKRSKKLKCFGCQRGGASIGCMKEDCERSYHFACAVRGKCSFNCTTRTIFCSTHADDKVGTGEQRINEFIKTSNMRKLFLDTFIGVDTVALIGALLDAGGRTGARIGTLRILSIGHIESDVETFHNELFIYPVGYHAIRSYWSLFDGTKRIDYLCLIENKNDMPFYTISPLEWPDTITDAEKKEYVLAGPSIGLLWFRFMSHLSALKKAKPFIIKAEVFFGLTDTTVTTLIENIPETIRCKRYERKLVLDTKGFEEKLSVNSSGCARAQGVTRRNTSPQVVNKNDIYVESTIISMINQQALAEQHFHPASIVPDKKLEKKLKMDGAVLFSNQLQYSRLKSDPSKIQIKPSRIHSLGAFATKHIVRGEFIIEYVGEIIRQKLADVREKRYQREGLDCFMFKLDSDIIVDATKRGNRARFANHSCDPSAKTKIIALDSSKKIVIVAKRDIELGEEITYDYRFPLEKMKIKCHCQSAKCRRYLN
eukprot:gene15724-18683_t